MATAKVKIKKEKVLEALRATLEAKKAYPENYKKALAQYEKEMTVFNNKVAALVKGKKPTTIEYQEWREEGSVRLTFKIDLKGITEPTRPQHWADWTLKGEITEIEQSIRLLEMCDDSDVSATLLKSFAQYL